MNRKQHGDRVAEIGVDDRSDHARRQFGGSGFVHLIAQLGPELVGVLDVLLQLDSDSHQSRAAGRVGLLLAHLRELEDVLFQLPRDLLFHLFGGSAGIRGQQQALADGNAGILGSRHRQKRMDPHRHRHRRQNDGNQRIAQRAFDGVHMPTSPPSRRLRQPHREAGPDRRERSIRLPPVRS